jgi:hypothetical protein
VPSRPELATGDLERVHPALVGDPDVLEEISHFAAVGGHPRECRRIVVAGPFGNVDGELPEANSEGLVGSLSDLSHDGDLGAHRDLYSSQRLPMWFSRTTSLHPADMVARIPAFTHGPYG